MTELTDQQQQSQQPKLRSNLKSNQPNHRIYEEAYGSQGNLDNLDQVISDLKQMKPSTKSILKRYDSSEKMNPISRPVSSISNHQFTADFNSTHCGSTLPRNHNAHHQTRGKLNSTTADLTSASAACFSNHQPAPQQRKRVQFANIPPLQSASSVGDLSSNTRANRFTNEPQFRRDSRGNRQSHHEDMYQDRSSRRSHGRTSHRRSSSTSNFNSSSLSSRSSHGRHASSGHHNNRYNSHTRSRNMSNRSLNLPADYMNNTGDYGEYNSACEFDDDRTCSTCSYSSSNSATSTDSESDFDTDDGFGCDPLDAYQRNYRAPAASLPRSSHSSSRMMASASDTFQRKYNSGLKISYVDNLPLARTNPAPEHKKKPKKSSSSGGSGSKKNKSISKFKKDNCTVS